MEPPFLERLYRDHRHAMWNAALHLSGDAATAEDVIHDVFAALAASLAAEPRAIEFPRTYLLRAVLHRVRDLRRRGWANREDGGSEAQLAQVRDPAPGPDHACAAGEAAAVVGAAIGALPLAQREVVVLRVFEGLAFREIGDLCAIPTHTAASRWRYGCTALRSFLTREGIRAPEGINS